MSCLIPVDISSADKYYAVNYNASTCTGSSWGVELKRTTFLNGMELKHVFVQGKY